MARIIIFDVDSTLLSVESLDFAVARALASQPGGEARAAELAAITDKGMAGALDFRQSLEQRIAIAGLTSDDIMPASVALAELITPGMFELTHALRGKGHGVFAVSGGFLELLGPALSTLGFMPGDIRANRFVFDADGKVTDFDRDNPLSRSGGKGPVAAALKSLTGADLAVMVGDGITDFEAFASGGADAFIGFGGVVRREAVAQRAPAYAGSVDELAKLLGV
ncbi:HAD-IB family phosphatase [Glycocaulis abyssi]|uniref:phosphoserine phosphatase n=1 Tax=Glycocaulis abyssi TaxID=1433403 RepID=A0ABV9ND04_9PROT